MNDEITDSPCPVDDLTEKAREQINCAQDGAKEALAAAANYIRANPWIAVAGAAVIGGAVVAMGNHRKPPSRNLDAVRDWLDEAYARLPSQKQVHSMAESSGIPDFLNQLRKKIHRN